MLMWVARAWGAVLSVCSFITGLSPAQRKLVYKLAAAVGLSISVKFGIDSHDATQWIATAVTFVSTFLVPVLAHTKVSEQ